MGTNVKDKLKYCGEDVRLYQLAKINVPECIEIDECFHFWRMLQSIIIVL